MPSDARYSIAVTWSMGYHVTFYHLLLTDPTREIPFKGGRPRNHDLSPEQIRFSYDRGMRVGQAATRSPGRYDDLHGDLLTSQAGWSRSGPSPREDAACRS